MTLSDFEKRDARAEFFRHARTVWPRTAKFGT